MKFIKKHKITSIVFLLLLLFFGFICFSAAAKMPDFKVSYWISYLFIVIICSAIFTVPVFVIELIVQLAKKKRIEKPSKEIIPESQKTPSNNTRPDCNVCDQPIIGRAEVNTAEPNSFITIDFETATNDYNSACSIGIIKVIGTEIAEKEYFLIQPPKNKYLEENTALHGISPDMTSDAETFDKIWVKIKHYFENTCVIAHNALFDLSVLKAVLHFYNIEYPEFYFSDSIPISNPLCPGISRKLDERCKYLNIPLDNHHNALSDAEACANIVICALKTSNATSINDIISKVENLPDFSCIALKDSYNFGAKKTSYKKSKTAREVTENIDISDVEIDADFDGKTFAFTGELEAMTREEAYEQVVLGGGAVKDNVSKKVDFLVNADTKMTTKVKRALELQEQGHHIKIITEEQFMRMLESKEAIEL